MNANRANVLWVFCVTVFSIASWTAAQPFVDPFESEDNEGEIANELVDDGDDNEGADSDESTSENVTNLSGHISRVTLYREQALVTREISLPADSSDVITVNDLPELVVPDSIFAEGSDGIEIRAVRVSSNTAEQANRQDIRELDKSMRELSERLEATQRDLKSIEANEVSLASIINFSVNRVNDAINKSVVQAEDVIALSNYIMEQRIELGRNKLELETEVEEVQREIDSLNRKRSSLVSGDQNKNYQVKIFTASQNDGAGLIKLNYLVTGCGWSPQYVVRGSMGSQTFTLGYSAMVRQISGEAWDKIKLTLSTASPSVNAMGPTLTPMRVSLKDGSNVNGDAYGAQTANQDDMQFRQGAIGNDLNKAANSIRQKQKSAENQAYGKSSSGFMQRDLSLNQLAGQLQTLELDAAANVASQIAQNADDDVATQIYSLDALISLQSRREQQLVQIAELKLEGELYHVATPLLASYAYRQAELKNSGSIGLLGGPASVYLDDRFVGLTNVPSTASGQQLVVGFGADQQVRTRRELRAKQDTIRGGNRNLEFTYRLVLSNFKDKAVKLRLYDRMPVSNEAREVAVVLGKTTEELSQDPLYERIGRQRGILRWDLEIPANRNGGQAFDTEYTYSLEFDRNSQLDTASSREEMQTDFLFDQNAGGMGGTGGGGSGGLFDQ